MTNQFAGLPVDVGSFQVIKLVANQIENLRTYYYPDEIALTVNYLAIHDRLPCPRRAPWQKGALVGRQ
jgi:hypothetical protein